MSGTSTEGRVYHERHDHVLKIVIDNPAKKNAFSPKMMEQLSDAFTLLDKEEDLWVGVLCANGDNFTAGLDMPKFFGPTATREPRPEGISIPSAWQTNVGSQSSPPLQELYLRSASK
jgi:enoyl-CoA hydratase/carnithine racemase